jgi:hypothetical protein
MKKGRFLARWYGRRTSPTDSNARRACPRRAPRNPAKRPVPYVSKERLCYSGGGWNVKVMFRYQRL